MSTRERVYEAIKSHGPITPYGIIIAIADETENKLLLTVPVVFEHIASLLGDGLIWGEKMLDETFSHEIRVHYRITGKRSEIPSERDIERVTEVKRHHAPKLKPGFAS